MAAREALGNTIPRIRVEGAGAHVTIPAGVVPSIIGLVHIDGAAVLAYLLFGAYQPIQEDAWETSFHASYLGFWPSPAEFAAATLSDAAEPWAAADDVPAEVQGELLHSFMFVADGGGCYVFQ